MFLILSSRVATFALKIKSFFSSPVDELLFGLSQLNESAFKHRCHILQIVMCFLTLPKELGSLHSQLCLAPVNVLAEARISHILLAQPGFLRGPQMPMISSSQEP